MRKRKIGVYLVLTLLSCMFFIMPAQAAYYRELGQGSVSKDLNGDGRKENIKVTLQYNGTAQYYYSKANLYNYVVWVNGKKVLTVPNVRQMILFDYNKNDKKLNLFVAWNKAASFTKQPRISVYEYAQKKWKLIAENSATSTETKYAITSVGHITGLMDVTQLKKNKQIPVNIELYGNGSEVNYGLLSAQMVIKNKKLVLVTPQTIVNRFPDSMYSVSKKVYLCDSTGKRVLYTLSRNEAYEVERVKITKNYIGIKVYNLVFNNKYEMYVAGRKKGWIFVKPRNVKVKASDMMGE